MKWLVEHAGVLPAAVVLAIAAGLWVLERVGGWSRGRRD